MQRTVWPCSPGDAAEALAADLGAEGAGEAEEELGGEAFEFAPSEDRLYLIQAGGEAGEFQLLGRQEAGLKILLVQALEGVNLRLEFALPG